MDFRGIETFGDWREAIAGSGADAVDICLPTSLHAAAAIAALEAGKHVLVEKPMALDSQSASAMIVAARSAGRILMVAQVLRFFPAYKALAGAVRSGKLGAIRMAEFRRRSAAPRWSPWLLDPAQSGGAVLDLLIHDIDMCLHLFGPPEAVAATGHADAARGIDLTGAHLHYDDLCAVVAGGWYPGDSLPFSMEYTVAADHGVIEYRLADGAPALHRAGGGREELPVADADGYQSEIEYFVNCCRANRQPELCAPEESAAAVRVAGWIRESRARGGETIPCRF
jgi:predicted dehydrogenase